MSEEVATCPDCGVASVEWNTANGMRARRDGDRCAYYCKKCGHRFDEPEYRAPKGHRNSQSRGARLLADADPDDFPA